MGDLSADLLAGGDDERRLVGLRGEDGADRVAHAGRRVQVDVGRPSGRLRIPVRHAHDRLLL